MTNDVKTKCGFVTVMGESNAGKSTLINKITGENISIISPKVQTTRTRILAIMTEDDSQVIMIDTPGIFKPRRQFDRAMLAAAWQGMIDADIIILLIDASKKSLSEETIAVIDRIKNNSEGGDKRPVWLALNKIDKIAPDKLLDKSQKLNEMFDFDKTFMISALKNRGLKDLKKAMKDNIPDCEFIFDTDDITDMPMRLLAAEITREQVFVQLHKELPYAITVETEQWEIFDNGSVKINQIIYVEKGSQKSIILGRAGTRIRQIGETSRKNIEKIMDCQIHLKLFVKVKENWAEDPERYTAIGLEP